MGIEKEIHKLEKIIDPDVRLDSMRFDCGNNTAGIRVRKVMQTIRKQAENIRNLIIYERERRKISRRRKK